jgi:hypothetical protein
METTLYEVKLKDGRTWRINCENKAQKIRFMNVLYSITDKVEKWRAIANGIHTVKDWETIAKKIRTQN